MPSNQAAFLTAKGAPLSIDSAPLLEPKPNEVLVKNRAVAINPVDWATQFMGQELFPSLQFPCILGEDVAGEVVAVGTAVTRARVGDRVLGYCSREQEREQGTFQEYSILRDNLFSPIPESMSFEEACVLPLGLSTAACGIFPKDQLALPYPSVHPEPLGKTLLVWSGASSVGCNAIQLGVAAGCDVITTCSPKNNELVKKLGATQTFDYNSEAVVNDILTYLEDKTLAGAVCIPNVIAIRAGHGQNAATQCLEIVSKANGNKFVAMAQPHNGPTPDGVESKFIMGGSLSSTELGAAVYADYLPQALAEGKFFPAPEPMVVGKGLGSLQQAMEVQMKGVSAKKVVVSL